MSERKASYENIKISTLLGVLNKELPITKVVGNRKVGEGKFEVAFVCTHRETGEPVWDTENDKLKLRWVPSKPRT